MTQQQTNITPEQLKPGRFEKEVLPTSANWNIQPVYDLISANPDTLDDILSDRNCTLLFFMWLSYGSFTTRQMPHNLKTLPDKLWNALCSHRWIDAYASENIDSIFAQTFGKNVSVSGHKLYATCGDFNNFNETFSLYLHNMYRFLSSDNRIMFQNTIPTSDIGTLFYHNYDAHFSINEYLPAINRLNRHIDISSIIHDLFSRLSVSASVREMLKDFKTQKDPSKFPILWERLAGHPDFGIKMTELSRTIKTWSEVNKLRHRGAIQNLHKEK